MIDFYFDEHRAAEGAAAFHLDVRPGLDGPSSFVQRARMGVRAAYMRRACALNAPPTAAGVCVVCTRRLALPVHGHAAAAAQRGGCGSVGGGCSYDDAGDCRKDCRSLIAYRVLRQTLTFYYYSVMAGHGGLITVYEDNKACVQ